jgi:ATP-dependent Lon protease
MTPFDERINEAFPGKVVRKDLTAMIKGNAVVPTFVLEYLLGQYCATDEEETIMRGIDTVKKILRKHYVHREEAELIKSQIRDRGSYRVIDRLSVELDDRKDVHVATFTNLGLQRVPIGDDWVRRFPKLLTGGVWCLVDVSYESREERDVLPWLVENVKPIQLSNFDFVEFLLGRDKFTTEAWMDILMQTIGFNPEHFSHRGKLLQLTRLISFAEQNFNFIELGPKGTGKSHVFSEFSPHGMLISGGEVTLAKLFVNNATGNIGLVGYWDSVAFDEFAGKEKRIPQNLVDVMKNYMANRSFSRGRESLGAVASMAFIGNTKRSVNYMLKHSDLFEQLPKAYYDTAFLDRLHFYLPGWEIDIIRGEMFTDGYGFIVDYLAEILRFLRTEDFGTYYQKFFTLDATIATRDRLAIHKTFSGLMKVLFPGGECRKEEVRELLELAIEGRRRVKLQLMKMDETFREREVRFVYLDKETDKEHEVVTLEELQYDRALSKGASQVANPTDNSRVGKASSVEQPGLPASVPAPVTPSVNERLPSGINIVVKENQRGVSYDNLFGEYLKGVSEIHLVDPYIRLFYQVKNLQELCRLVYRYKEPGDEVAIKLVTNAKDEEKAEVEKLLCQLEASLFGTGIDLSFDIEADRAQHDRYLETNTGYKIILGRGLDIFQPYDLKDPFALANTVQEERSCKDFEVTIIDRNEAADHGH